MKNYILKYSSYSDNIFGGNDIEIKNAYFSGIKFISEHNICFLYFDTITVEDRPIILSFRIDFESTREFDRFFNNYSHLFIRGITSAINIPALMAVSCFYKQSNKQDTWYQLYAIQTNSEESGIVYRLDIWQNIFYQIMFILNKIRNLDMIDEGSNFSIFNKFNFFKQDIRTINLSQYTPSIPDQKLFCNKPPRFHSKTFLCYCMVDFSKGDDRFALCLPIDVENKYYKPNKNKFIKNILNFDYQMSLNEKTAFYISDSFPIEYSISADVPMSRYIFVGLSVACNEYRYFKIPEDTFLKINDFCLEYIKK